MHQHMSGLPRYSFPLFVPAHRADRFEKAAAAGTDTIIIDLEDAVAAERKDEARRGLHGAMENISGAHVWLRINGKDTPWYNADLAEGVANRFDGIIVPKAESATELAVLRARLRSDQRLIALVETAKGVLAAGEIAQTCDRMAFGSVDYGLDVNSAASREACLMARSTLVLASRAADLPPPLDGVTTKIKDEVLVREDSAHACELGFGGKLLIHPGQIKHAREGFAPSAEEQDWARRIVDETKTGEAGSVNGEMIDHPVLERARGILERARGFE